MCSFMISYVILRSFILYSTILLVGTNETKNFSETNEQMKKSWKGYIEEINISAIKV